MTDMKQAVGNPVFRPGLHRAKVLSIAQPGTYAVFYDTETTGLHAAQGDHIIEFAGILCRIEDDYSITRLADKQIYIKNRKPLTEKVIEITKLTDAFLADKPEESEVAQEIFDFLCQADWVCGHNLPFDNTMIRTTMERNNLPVPLDEYLDTLVLTRDIIQPNTTANHKLETLATAFHLEDGVQFHSAIDDIGATVALFEILLKQYLAQDENDVPEYLDPKIQRVSYWEKQTDTNLLQRLYVTTDLGSFYYDVTSDYLGTKDCDITRVNREKFDADVMKFHGVNTMESLLAFRGKKYN